MRIRNLTFSAKYKKEMNMNLYFESVCRDGTNEDARDVDVGVWDGGTVQSGGL